MSDREPESDAAPHSQKASDVSLTSATNSGQTFRPAKTDGLFYTGLLILGGSYILFIVSMLGADIYYTYVSANHDEVVATLISEDIQYAIRLSLISCTITMILSMWVAVPIGYVMSRHQFFGKQFIDAILDIPIVLPPLVIGISLLILFTQTPAREINDLLNIALYPPAVVIAQFSVACAFAVRTLRATFDEIPIRREQVALTLGCSRSQAFWSVVLPEARHGLLTAATLAWAKSLGEFGPILIFAGTTRQRTEVLPVSVHLEFAAGKLEAAVAISLMMVVIALTVLILFRVLVGGSLLPKMNR